MNLTSIQIVSNQDQLKRVYRLHKGTGIFEKVIAIQDLPKEIELISKAMTFAFRSIKSKDIEEVILDITDNSGETWTIHRGGFGSRFLKAGKPIPIDEAQRSMLASWLDMEAGLSSLEGLISPISSFLLTSKNGRFAASSSFSVSDTPIESDINPEKIIQLLTEECFKAVGIPEYRDANRLLKVSEGLTEIRGRFREVLGLVDGKSGEHAPSLVLVESMQKELDHLLHIDFLCRKMGDAEESIPRLSGQLNQLMDRIAVLKSKWPEKAISDCHDTAQWQLGFDSLVRMKAYQSLNDTAVRIKRLVHERVRPLADQAFSAWDDFLSGSQGTGQDLESCIASTLLGLKQITQDLNRIKVHSTLDGRATATENQSSSTWLDKLRGTKQRQESSTFESPVTLAHHSDWLAKTSGDLERVKETVTYSLSSIQSFVDELAKSKGQSRKGLHQIEDVAKKTQEELDKLTSTWTEWATVMNLDPSISIESLSRLIFDATEYNLLMIQHQDLEARINERQQIQEHLANLVRQWWTIIGSDRKVDITNPAFLVAEARAALRYRETRRQRIQKAVKDSAKSSRDEAIKVLAHKRKSELLGMWKDTFERAGLPALDMEDRNVDLILKIGSAIQAMHQLQAMREDCAFEKGLHLLTTDHSPIIVLSWLEAQSSDLNRAAFLDLLQTESKKLANSIILVLVTDESTVEACGQLGCGSSIKVQSTTASNTIKPSARATLPRQQRISQGSEVSLQKKSSSETQSPLPPELGRKEKSKMSPRAAAVLQILNPKEQNSISKK
ncbi:MAG: hypothetical protein NT027_15405 [Proteobacteria bacterium]|nr:hypothetical protein [Pseudomonadota bacterium]